MNKITLCLTALLMAASSVSSASPAGKSPFNDYVYRAGRATGLAMACNHHPEVINKFETRVSEYAKTHWPTGTKTEFEVNYIVGRLEGSKDPRASDVFYCEDQKLTLYEALHNPASILDAPTVRIAPEKSARLHFPDDGANAIARQFEEDASALGSMAGEMAICRLDTKSLTTAALMTYDQAEKTFPSINADRLKARYETGRALSKVRYKPSAQRPCLTQADVTHQITQVLELAQTLKEQANTRRHSRYDAAPGTGRTPWPPTGRETRPKSEGGWNAITQMMSRPFSNAVETSPGQHR